MDAISSTTAAPVSTLPPVAATMAPAISQEFFDRPMKLLAALSDGTRWGIVRLLAGGEARSVQEVAAALKRDPDVVSRHLKVLSDVSVVAVAAVPGADGRKQFYAVPERFRRRDEAGRPMVDFGVCVLRFPPTA